MASDRVEKAKELWNVWDIRVLILISLLIQVVLTFLAPLRKRCASTYLKLVLWFLYLSASAIALYIISQITGHPDDVPAKLDLLAFWAPFLLLHLGGPDSITALALEDNELWLRHALELMTQLVVTSYVFANSVRHRSWLVAPTVFMFVDGLIKYTERTQALYKASIDTFRDSLATDPEPGPNYARLMDVYYYSKSANIPTGIQGPDDPSAEAQASHPVQSIPIPTESNLMASGNQVSDNDQTTLNPTEGIVMVAGNQASHNPDSIINDQTTLNPTEGIVMVAGNQASHNPDPIIFDQTTLNPTDVTLTVAINQASHNPDSKINDQATLNPTEGSVKIADNQTSHNPVSKSKDQSILNASDALVVDAYWFYKKFKGLLADNFLSLKDRKECREKFLKKDGPESIEIIQIELNLIYDMFYTKAFLLDSNQANLRLVSYVCVIASLLWFSFLDKNNYEPMDVIITYILLAGAFALDLSAILMLVLSDWYVIIDIKRKILKQWENRMSTTLLKWVEWMRSWKTDRWSRSICTYNLLHRFFKEPPHVFKKVGPRIFKDVLIGLLYVETNYTDEKIITDFIVGELIKKANKQVGEGDLEAIKDVCLARGNLIFDEDYCLISDYLRPWTTDVDYDESLLTWHIATDICYHTCTSKQDISIKDDREISKILSEYMAYLILRQQTLMSGVVGMSDRRFLDTCAEAKKIMMNENFNSWGMHFRRKIKYFLYTVSCQWSKIGESTKEKETKFLDRFRDRLLKVNVDVQPIIAKGDKSKSVLYEACRLAKQLNKLGAKRQWEIIKKVWLELMCYAAVRCSPQSHVAQLNNGGELITLVWLLMAHLGFGDRYLQNQGFGWTKLIIQK